MTHLLKQNRKKTALLVMDYQMLVINNYLSEDQANTVINNTSKLLKAFRSKDMEIIYITVQFQEGHPEISSKNKVFKKVKEFNLFRVGAPDTAIHKELEPLSNEAIIIKNRIGAFSFTNLDLVLRSHGIDTLVMAGLTTSGVVLSTVRQAFDLDYTLYVVKDCCADSNEKLHELLMNDIFPEHTNVVNSLQIIEAL